MAGSDIFQSAPTGRSIEDSGKTCRRPPRAMVGVYQVTIRNAAHFVYSTSPGITMGNDLKSFIGTQLCVLPCMSVATTR